MRLLIAAVCGLAAGAGAIAAEVDWSKVDGAMGRKGTEQPGGVHKYAFPRSDLTVTVDGVAIKPALALGGWVAFQPTSRGAMVMGDLVLTDTEISPVMKSLVSENVEITAIHNHLLRTNVPVFYMHVGGHGDPVKFAKAINTALAQSSKTPMTAPTPAPPATLDLDNAALEKTLGYPGKVNGGVFSSACRARRTSLKGRWPSRPQWARQWRSTFNPRVEGRPRSRAIWCYSGPRSIPC